MIKDIQAKLRAAIAPAKTNSKSFFKTAVGEYAAHDQFIGVSVPNIRLLAKQYPAATFATLAKLLQSAINEERLLALIILVNRYKISNIQDKQEIYNFYMANLRYVNNWNLVDSSAHLILGAHLIGTKDNCLLQLAQSDILWERRIAIIATWAFIKNNNLQPTYRIATQLLHDEHDLIHKAVGWMLREAGKKDETRLCTFLDRYASEMPRTMLRYAIERLPETVRKGYLTK